MPDFSESEMEQWYQRKTASRRARKELRQMREEIASLKEQLQDLLPQPEDQPNEPDGSPNPPPDEQETPSPLNIPVPETPAETPGVLARLLTSMKAPGQKGQARRAAKRAARRQPKAASQSDEYQLEA